MLSEVRFGSITSLLSNQGMSGVPSIAAVITNIDFGRDVPGTAVSRCSKSHHYSITSSARSGNPGGMLNPSALAVFMLITSSNFAGA